MSPAGSVAELKRVLARLERDVFSDLEEDSPWGLGFGYRLEIHFTEADRQLVRSFLNPAMTDLEAELHGRLPNFRLNPPVGQVTGLAKAAGPAPVLPPGHAERSAARPVVAAR